MSHNNKSGLGSWVYGLIGVAVGALSMYAWLLTQKPHELKLIGASERGRNPESTYSFRSNIGISPTDASAYFMRYQVDEQLPQGLLQAKVGGEDEAIIGYFLDKRITTYLDDNARSRISAPLDGYFLMLGHKENVGHIAMLAGVYEDEHEQLSLLLPSQAADETLIAKHLLQCPPHCPKNVAEGILWEKDWLEP